MYTVRVVDTAPVGLCHVVLADGDVPVYRMHIAGTSLAHATLDTPIFRPSAASPGSRIHREGRPGQLWGGGGPQPAF